jgi:hypothetical protein
MSKSRKNKIVPVREPNGRLSRASEDAVKAVSPVAIRRLRDAAIRGMADAEWGTEIGRLYLEGKLNEASYEAGKRWNRLVAAYHKAIGATPPYPKAIAFKRAEPSHEPHEDSDAGKKQIARDKDIIADMREAHAVLLGAGKIAEYAVRSTCEENEAPVGSIGLDGLQRGLAWLAQHWGLTEQRKNVRFPT